MHDGSTVRFRKTRRRLRSDESRCSRMRTCARARQRGEVATGLLFIDENGADMHAVAKTVDDAARRTCRSRQLCPGNDGAAGVDGEISVAYVSMKPNRARLCRP